MARPLIVVALCTLVQISQGSQPVEVAAFRGSSEHGLLEARAQVTRGARLYQLRHYSEATRLLWEGCRGLEDSFDRLSGLEEIVQAHLLMAQAELRAGHRDEALRAAEALRVLGQPAPPVDQKASRGLRALLDEAERRVASGPRGVVRVTSVVKGQSIDLDGAPRGVTPERFELPVGRHFIWVQTPLGPIPYRVDLHEGESLVVGQGEPEEVVDEPSDEAGSVHAARRPVLPHRR